MTKRCWKPPTSGRLLETRLSVWDQHGRKAARPPNQPACGQKGQPLLATEANLTRAAAVSMLAHPARLPTGWDLVRDPVVTTDQFGQEPAAPGHPPGPSCWKTGISR